MFMNILSKNFIKSLIFAQLALWSSPVFPHVPHEAQINLLVPDYTLNGPVYLTGNMPECQWRPRCLRLFGTENPRIKTIFIASARDKVQIKITRGSWTSEGIVKSPWNNPNIVLDLSKQKHFSLQVKHWKDQLGLFEEQVRAHEREDALQNNYGKTVFAGSSSIRLWDNFYDDFKGRRVLQRGAGGARIKDLHVYLNRLALKHSPPKIFLYIGENDLAYGASPEQVADGVGSLVERIQREAPNARLFYISIKPSPARMFMLNEIKQANALLKRKLASKQVKYIDVFSSMMETEDEVKEDIWKSDLLHMNQKGYDLWKEKILPLL